MTYLISATAGLDAIHSLLAQTTNFPVWRPFLTPMPVWDYWFWLLLPLSIGVAVAYKTTKVGEVRAIPRESVLLAIWIVGGLIAAAAAVAIVARLA